MIFSDPTNLTGLVEDMDFICATDSTSFPLKDKARLANRWHYKAVIRMVQSNGDWTYIDSNTGKLDYFTATLVDQQQDYSIPSSALQIEGVSVLDSNGDYQKLDYVSLADLKKDRSEYLNVAGLPEKYTITGNSILLFPAPSSSDVTLAAGIKVEASKEIDQFVSTDTTQEPGLPEPFHRICSWGPSYEWLLLNGDKEKAVAAKQEAESLLMELADFHRVRNAEVPVRLKPAHNQREYL